MSIKVEFSPNSRATCQLCGERIRSGERRLYGKLGSGRYGYYYHLDCIVRMCKPELDKIFAYMYLIKQMVPVYPELRLVRALAEQQSRRNENAV